MCGQETTAGFVAHVWRDTAQPGDLCLCGRRFLPARARLVDEPDRDLSAER